MKAIVSLSHASRLCSCCAAGSSLYMYMRVLSGAEPLLLHRRRASVAFFSQCQTRQRTKSTTSCHALGIRACRSRQARSYWTWGPRPGHRSIGTALQSAVAHGSHRTFSSTKLWKRPGLPPGMRQHPPCDHPPTCRQQWSALTSPTAWHPRSLERRLAPGAAVAGRAAPRARARPGFEDWLSASKKTTATLVEPALLLLRSCLLSRRMPSGRRHHGGGMCSLGMRTLAAGGCESRAARHRRTAWASASPVCMLQHFPGCTNSSARRRRLLRGGRRPASRQRHRRVVPAGVLRLGGQPRAQP